MNNEQYIKQIMQMNERQLLAEVMTNPEYLFDSYYGEFGAALQKQFEKLKSKGEVK